MDIVSQWVKNIVFIILFTTLLEMFLPASEMQKYVRVVMGFFIIIVFLSPITVILNQDLTAIDRIIPGNIISNNWEEIQKKGEEIENSNHVLMKSYYEKKIGERVREITELDYAGYEQNIDLKVNDDYQISSLDITLTDRNIHIKPVEIGRQEEKDSLTNELEVAGLERKLGNIFQIPVNLINIRVKDGGE
jgi:stage III sporulation protein AF